MYLKDIVADYLPNIKVNNNYFVIGITGNVCSGKSSFAKYLKKELKKIFVNERIKIISTDDFLQTNKYLLNHNLFEKKGWEETYDHTKIKNFFWNLANKNESTLSGIYDQVLGDIIDHKLEIKDPTILIVEGTMALNAMFNEFIDFSIFLNVNLETNFEWYKKRTLKNMSYKEEYCHIKSEEAVGLIKTIWEETNLKTFYTYILPTQKKANAWIDLNEEHQIEKIKIQ